MASLNKVQLIGNVGQEPEVFTTERGTIVANFSLATTEKWKDQNGNQQSETEWHRITFFDKTAQIVEQYVRKGSAVYVEGRIKSRRYTDKEGIERTAYDIMGRDIQLLGDSRRAQENSGSAIEAYEQKKAAQANGQQPANQPAAQANRPAQPAPASRPAAPAAPPTMFAPDEEDDLPF